MRPGAADVTVLAHPVQALGDRAGAGDLGVEGLGELLDHGQVLLGLQAAADADHPVGGAEIRLVEAVHPGLDHLQAKRRGGHLLDRRAGAAGRGTGPPSSSSATGPETATASSAMSPKTALTTTTTTSPPKATERAPVRTAAPSRAAAAPKHPLPGVTAAENDAGRVGRDSAGHRRGARLGRRVTRRAAPHHLVHAARGHRLGHRPGPGHHRPDRAAQGTRDRDEVTNRRLIPDDDPGAHAHDLVLPLQRAGRAERGDELGGGRGRVGGVDQLAPAGPALRDRPARGGA